MKLSKTLSCLFTFLFTGSMFLWGMDGKGIRQLADSVHHLSGKAGFFAVCDAYLRQAKAADDTVHINEAYQEMVGHYYTLGDIDSLKLVSFDYMDWNAKRGNQKARYQTWRQYIQRMTERGMREEVLKETEALRQDAEKNKDKYGLASSEMCIGYSCRVFANDVSKCIDYYKNALNLFEESSHFEDAYIVSLNILQTYIASEQIKKGIEFLPRLEKLTDEMARRNIEIREELLLKYYQFRVILTLADKGKRAAQKYIEEADRYYYQHRSEISAESWYGYKILCSRTLNDYGSMLNDLDSLLSYHRSIGACYPANYLFRAQTLQGLGRLKEACNEYVNYAHINDSVHSAEMDDRLSKYTVQFEVNKLEMEKLELEAQISRNRLQTAIMVGCCIFVLLIIITYFYVRTLKINKKLDAARLEAQEASKMKTSFIRSITHEVRTPLNSIVGFSSLVANSIKNDSETQEYASVIEENSRYLVDLVDNVIDIADLDSMTGKDLTIQDVDINACCNECADILRANLKEGIELKYTFYNEPLILRGNAALLRKMLLVLLNNANKFTEKGEIRFVYEWLKEPGKLRFVVEDTGRGIPVEYKDAIFDRFYKIDNFTQGTGLGLSVVRLIVDRMRGEVYLDTSYTDGARFIVELPV